MSMFESSKEPPRTQVVVHSLRFVELVFELQISQWCVSSVFSSPFLFTLFFRESSTKWGYLYDLRPRSLQALETHVVSVLLLSEGNGGS